MDSSTPASLHSLVYASRMDSSKLPLSSHEQDSSSILSTLLPPLVHVSPQARENERVTSLTIGYEPFNGEQTGTSVECSSPHERLSSSADVQLTTTSVTSQGLSLSTTSQFSRPSVTSQLSAAAMTSQFFSSSVTSQLSSTRVTTQLLNSSVTLQFSTAAATPQISSSAAPFRLSVTSVTSEHTPTSLTRYNCEGRFTRGLISPPPAAGWTSRDCIPDVEHRGDDTPSGGRGGATTHFRRRLFTVESLLTPD